MNALRVAIAYAQANREQSVADLADFLRIPSVSSQPAHAADTARCAAWLAGRLRRAGLREAQVVPTPGHPLVVGRWRDAQGAPTVLIYGHYDVQPPEPLAAWRSPPFEPTQRGPDLHGRGASDDKGQLLAHVAALEAYLKTAGRLPANVICLFEGEEEIGSPHLGPFLARAAARWPVDAVVISDTAMRGPGQPAIIYALRGGLNCELTVDGPAADLHSGTFGGAVLNPIQALCEMLACLHTPDGRVAVPGFYESVRRWSHAERSCMARSGPGAAEILRSAGVQQGWGEPGYTLHERTTIRPALTINGIQGGYAGPGAKGVIPTRASAKLGVRLVPDQDPHAVAACLSDFLEHVTPDGIQASLRFGIAAPATLIDLHAPAMQAAAQAAERAFGRLPVFLRSGGTIPVVNMFQDLLRVPVVLLGFGLPDDAIHGPNERLHLPNFYGGIEASIYLLDELARQRPYHAEEAEAPDRRSMVPGRRPMAATSPMPGRPAQAPPPPPRSAPSARLRMAVDRFRAILDNDLLVRYGQQYWQALVYATLQQNNIPAPARAVPTPGAGAQFGILWREYLETGGPAMPHALSAFLAARRTPLNWGLYAGLREDSAHRCHDTVENVVRVLLQQGGMPGPKQAANRQPVYTARDHLCRPNGAIEPGKGFVVLYRPLGQVVADLRQSLDDGFVTLTGVQSGILPGTPQHLPVEWRFTDPEHWLLIIGYDGDTFAFWDPSAWRSQVAGFGRGFGLLYYVHGTGQPERFTTACSNEDMRVDENGDHVYRCDTTASPHRCQHRYQVLQLEARPRAGERVGPPSGRGPVPASAQRTRQLT